MLIGGKGTRLRPLTYTVPKAMVTLRNRPFIQYMVDFLRAAGLEGAVLSMGYLPHPIRQHFAEQGLEGFTLEYVLESSPLGTAGGIKNAQEQLGGGEGPFVVTNGDVLTGLDLREVIEAHQSSDALATITLTPVEDPTAYGLVEVDHRLWVKRFVEKPISDEVRTSLINAGIYVLEREVLNMIPEGREVSIEREIFPELQAAGRLRAYISSAYWRDIGTPRSYLTASHDVLSGAIGRETGGLNQEGFSYMSVERSAQVSRDVALLPPVCVAKGCEVEAGATIGSRTSLGEGCLIEKGAMVEGSILFEGVRVGEGAVIRNAIVGPGARVGKGSIVRGLSVLGAGSVVEEGNVLDQGARVNPGARLPKGVLSF